MVTPWGTYVILDLEDKPWGTNPERDHAKMSYIVTDPQELQNYFQVAEKNLRRSRIYLSEREFLKSIVLMAISAASPLSLQGREQERENLSSNARWALRQLQKKTHKKEYRLLDTWLDNFTRDRS